jgi:TonB family protein
MRSGLGGRALVWLTIDTGGRVTSARIVQTSGSTLLDRAAVSLAYAYRFTTGHVVRTTRLPVTFRPPGGGLGS